MQKLKVLIVEDEFLIREVLKKYIESQSEFYTIIGEAASAAEAMDFLDESSCDIIITDINMPVMNGIEMIKSILKEKPHIKTIVVTGYDNFDYAQKGIKIGIDDYLLKPIDEKEVIASLNTVREKIINAQKQELEQKQILNQINEYIPYLIEAFLNDLMTKKLELDIIKEKLSLFKIHIFKEYFQVAIIKKVCEDLNKSQELFDLFAFKTIILDNLKDSFVFFDNHNRIILLNCLDSPHFIPDYEYLRTKMTNSLECILYMSIGSVIKGLENVRKSYIEAEQAMNYHSFLEYNHIIFYQDLNIINEKSSPTIKIEESHLDKFSFYLKGGLLKNAKEWIDEYFGKEHDNIDNLKIKAMQIMISMLSINIDLQLGLKDKFQEIFYLQTYQEIREFLINLVTDFIMHINKIRNNTVSDHMKNIEKYIEDNLSKKSLSLTSTAKHFYMNASYLSRIFKHKRGISFRDYISKMRIEKALEYLSNADIKAYEASLMVGIDDPNYFSTLFKKYTGMTITQYRSKI